MLFIPIEVTLVRLLDGLGRDLIKHLILVPFTCLQKGLKSRGA